MVQDYRDQRTILLTLLYLLEVPIYYLAQKKGQLAAAASSQLHFLKAGGERETGDN